MAAKKLLPEQDALLCELVDAYEAAGDRPTVRVSIAGRAGSRVWMWGKVRKELEGKRKPEDFTELRANGDLRQVSKDKTGWYYAITPNGLARPATLTRANAAAAAPSPKTTPKGVPPAVLSTAPSRLDVLRSLAAQTRDALDAVLAVSTVEERFAGTGVVVITPHPWSWGLLSPEGQRLVGEARTALDRWTEAASGAITVSAPERVADFTDELTNLRRVVERSSRSDGPTGPTIPDTQDHVHSALDQQLALVEDLPSAQAASATVAVPDTNALLLNPAMEAWNLGRARVVVTVLPQVIAELDSKKMDPKVGEKAKGLIRRFKEYDRRGNTLDGVPLAGRVVFREMADDPTFDGAPTWLSKRNADDRILAGALDLA
jgi:hypothetical protein